MALADFLRTEAAAETPAAPLTNFLVLQPSWSGMSRSSRALFMGPSPTGILRTQLFLFKVPLLTISSMVLTSPYQPVNMAFILVRSANLA